MKKILATLFLIIYLCFIHTPFCLAINYSASENDDVLTGYIAKIEKGTTFEAYLQTTINTATAQKHDEVIAVLTQDWIYNDILVAPQGSILRGEISKARSATFGYRNGYVQIDFKKLETLDGEIYNIATEKIDFEVDSEGKFKDAAQKVLTSTMIGAISGLIYALLSDNASRGKSTAIAAGAGVATGLVIAGFEQGIDAEIPIYTPITLTLDKQLRIMINE